MSRCLLLRLSHNRPVHILATLWAPGCDAPCGLLAGALPVGETLWGETLWGETFWCETLWGETLWCETLCCEALWCDTLWGETRLGPRNRGEGHGKPKMNILILRFE